MLIEHNTCHNGNEFRPACVYSRSEVNENARMLAYADYHWFTRALRLTDVGRCWG